jgi:hypothetical protein
MLGCECHHLAPAGLCFVDRTRKVGVQQQVSQFRVAGEGFSDLLQEGGTNDATTAEDLRYFTEVQLPIVLLLRFTHQLEALSVRADLRRVQGFSDRFDHLGLIALERSGFRTTQDLRSGNAFVLHC